MYADPDPLAGGDQGYVQVSGNWKGRDSPA